MARGAQKTPGPRKATHSRARCRRGGAPPTTLGQGRKELRFRFPQRQENARRSLRRQKPTHRLSPYVRSGVRSEEHTSELQSRFDLVCRLLLEKKKKTKNNIQPRQTIDAID